MTRPWWDGAVIYQVYPRSFADGDGDGRGDLPGVVSRLDHLAGGAASLGVDAVWLSPFYPHGGADGGYDVTDHTAVAPEFGSLADVDRLVSACHARGLRVLLDLVAGHVSVRHRWFREAVRQPAGSRRGWFTWAPRRPGGGPPSRARSVFGGSAWSPAADGAYYHHWFFAEQPDLNWANPAVVEAVAAVMGFWLDRGVDGFRVDAIDHLVRRPGGGRALRHLRGVADAHGGGLLLGEAYAPARRLATWIGHGGLQAAFDFGLAKSRWSAVAFARVIADAERHLRPPLAPTWAFSNHDLPRHATRWGPGRTRLAALLLLGLRGSIGLYQGEEVGMTDGRPPFAPPRDRAGRDPQRTALDWAAVSAQAADPDSLLALYRRLVSARRASPALRWGTLRLRGELPTGVLGWDREVPGERVTVIGNLGRHPARVDLPRGEVLVASHAHVAAEGPNAVLGPGRGLVVRHR